VVSDQELFDVAAFNSSNGQNLVLSFAAGAVATFLISVVVLRSTRGRREVGGWRHLDAQE
jgi:hypothetical protein